MKTLRISQRAFRKLVWLRDYKPCEVAVLGEADPSDAMLIHDVHLVKQTVSSVAADMDPDDITRHIADMIETKGLTATFTERVWIHTHPMTGASSANPSQKDMNTWNDVDNKNKHFLVMAILSKSGEMTCKVRIKTTSSVAGLTEPVYHEYDTKVEVLETEEDKAYINAKLIEIWGEKAATELRSIVLSKTDVALLYPEFAELKTQYDNLVTEKVYSTQYHGHYTNGNGYSVGKKRRAADATDVPELFTLVDQDCVTFHDIAAPTAALNRINGLGDFETLNIEDLRALEEEFYSSRPDSLTESFLIGLTSADNFSSNRINCGIPGYATKALCRAAQITHVEMKQFAKEFNSAI